MKVHLIAAGKFHDIDFARLELLKLLADAGIRTCVARRLCRTRPDDAAADLLITYTCDLVPTPDQTATLRSLPRTRRPLAGAARHQFHPALRRRRGRSTPDDAPEFMALLGTRFPRTRRSSRSRSRSVAIIALTAACAISRLSTECICEHRRRHRHLDAQRFPGGTFNDFANRLPAQQVPILYSQLGKARALLPRSYRA